MILYPFMIMGYSILLHPALATRLFIACMTLLAGVSWLVLKGILPYMPINYSNTESFNAWTDLLVNSDQARFYTIAGYSIVFFLNFLSLLVVNFLVRKLRQREDDLSVSNQEVQKKSEQVSSLSEKLKVYLPRQFVESLSHGDRDTVPDYQRRRLTIFFSDIKGFTVWCDKLEPEEVRELLNQYLSEMSIIARKWDGTIDKFIGDAILIFFGDPEFTSDRDHALRCVKMAMEMQEKMSLLRKHWGDAGYLEPLHIRIGINTGYATVGNFGSKDRLNYTVLGSAVNLAARLETVCQPDKITVSHNTYSLIKDDINCVSKGEVEVKGFSEPVKIYEVLAETAGSD